MQGLGVKEETLIERIAHSQAVVIDSGTLNNMFIAVPCGDRRKRPIAWISKVSLTRMISSGALISHTKGYVLASEYTNRTAVAGKCKKVYSAQVTAIDIDRQIQKPCATGLKISVVFRRLAGHKNRSGQPFLHAHELAAGERFARDYVQAQMGRTKNTMNKGACPTIGAQDRVGAALEMLGPGMDRTIIALCSREWGVQQLEASEGWPKRSAKTVLKLALARLSVFYGGVSDEDILHKHPAWHG